ncbi:hypothetical protein DFJ77DRAFT_479558 [Powellomyces hirtus]|nr:hypothetical protein DFJ77DRAFT_479558 [Powellomyces hirtus]
MNFFPRTAAQTKPPTRPSSHPSTFTRVYVQADQFRQSAHNAALKRFGQPYAALAERASQALWMGRVILDRYPTAKVFAYTLGIASIIPIFLFIFTSAALVAGSIIATVSSIGFFGGGFLAFSLFLAFGIACFATFWYTVAQIVVQAQKATAR